MASVLTPQEIARIIEKREKGNLAPATIGEMRPILDAATKMQDRVQDLERQVKKKRLSAVEMADGVQEVFKRYNFSAVEELVKMVAEKNDQDQYVMDVLGEKKLRVDILKTLVEYEAPKLKSVEVTGEVNHAHEITILRFGDDGTISREKPKKVIDVPAEVKVEHVA